MNNHYNKLVNLNFTKRVLEKNDENEEIYDSLDFFKRDYIFIKKINRLIPYNAKVLDLGCGNGKIILMLAQFRPDLSLVGKDISKKMIDKAKENQNRTRTIKNVQWVKGEIGKQIILGKYNFIFSHYVSHHLKVLSSILDEIYDSLVQNGQFYVKDFLRPLNKNDAMKQVKFTSSPYLTKEQMQIHFNSLQASFSFEEVRKVVASYKQKLVYNLKAGKYYWELSGYKNE